MLRLVFTLLTLSLLCVSSPGFAQDAPDQERAVRLAEEGGAAFQNGDYALAAQKFAEAHRYYPDLSLKMNEMAAWYKAQRCGEAIAVANFVTSSEQTLTEQDEKDLYKVHLECGYNDSEKMLERGELDAAEARLKGVRPLDPELASRVGELRGKIAERRKSIAENGESTDPEPEDPEKPPAAGPSWAKWGGFAGLGLGAGLGLAALVKFVAFDRANLNRWAEHFEKNYDCSLADDNSLDLEQCNNSTQASVDHETLRQELKKSNRASAALIIGAVVSGATGAGLLYYYTTQKSAAEGAADTAPEATFAPVFTPNYAGATFQIRF